MTILSSQSYIAEEIFADDKRGMIMVGYYRAY